MTRPIDLGRRRFVSGLAYTGAALLLPPWTERRVFAQGPPGVPLGVQAGDVTDESAVIWAASDRVAQLSVEFSTSERMHASRRVVGPVARPETGGAAKLVLSGLPAGADVFYEARFLDPQSGRPVSAPARGRLRTAAWDRRDVSFVWSGDTVGQGWGINPDFGGLRTYETMRRLQPDFFIHSGDMIYADGRLFEEVALRDGTIWRNLVTEEKSRVAQSLDDYRGNYRYNLIDQHLRLFNSEVAQYVQWDDHEVTNNWYPDRILSDLRYQERSCRVLAARGRQAMMEFTPITPQPPSEMRVHRTFRRGPLCDVFLLDLRSFRAPNSRGHQKDLGAEARIFESPQLVWLKGQLRASRALWKIVACPTPLSLVVQDDGKRRGAGYDGFAQGDGPALGRELELADLLSSLRRDRVRNVVFLTADVHYCATHRYDPGRARFDDFDPFYEFVSGPLHAGALGPNRLDGTFGPETVFRRAPPYQNPPPSAGFLNFGHGRVDGKTGVLTVTHRNVFGEILHQIELAPDRVA